MNFGLLALMDERDVSIATMTWARDAAEERLLRESLGRLATLRLPVYVTDGEIGRASCRERV